MLKQNLNINATTLSNKLNHEIFAILTNTSQQYLYKQYYEQKILDKENIIFEDLNEYLLEVFVPYGVSIRQIFLYKIYLEYLNKTYKFLRIIYNLPIRKTKTHNVSKKKKWIHTTSVTYCIKILPIFKKLKLPKSKIQVLFFCEFINSIWFFNWYRDWFSAYKARIKSVTKNPHIKWKYDVMGLQQGKAIFFTTKKKKTKHNRKKSVVLKNAYNVGFNYGFSLIHLKKILTSITK